MDNERKEMTLLKKFIDEAKSMSRSVLLEHEVKEVLRSMDVVVPKGVVVNGPIEAADGAAKVGYPLALKVISRDIPHKSDVGGVALGLKSEKDVETAWFEMFLSLADKRPGAIVDGFLIEEMAPKGIEVIVGVARDPQFGPIVMFGIGGVAVELYKDTSFRIAPVSKEEALKMMQEVKGYPLLSGYRNDGYDIDGVADVIVKLSGLISEDSDIKDLEINPLVVLRKGNMAVDARASLK